MTMTYSFSKTQKRRLTRRFIRTGAKFPCSGIAYLAATLAAWLVRRYEHRCRGGEQLRFPTLRPAYDFWRSPYR